jgi:threonylcarbamoyladenosine tRNA methylthiotransferase MtaB
VKVNFQALGCRLNEAELESWSQQFARYGHQLTLDSSEADLVVFNSCSVTAQADRKSRQLINRIQRDNPNGRLVVTGCYASLNPDSVKQRLGVDLVIDNREKDKLPEMVLDHFAESPSRLTEIDAQTSIFERGRQRAFIKVQDGCRYRCTFCIVTVARGEERSRQQPEIISEINHLHQQGVQEIVLTGVHVGGYGSDLGSSLYQLLAEILGKTSVPRIRLASVEPWDLPKNFFELFKDTRLMPHMHLPLQSGSDRILRRMARRCKTADFMHIVEQARNCNPSFNVTTDIIAGFPGETDEDWKSTIDFVEQAEFGKIHVFTYSPREGTKAAGLPDQVAEGVKKERSAQLHSLDNALHEKAMAKMVGEQHDVLWEHSVEYNLDAWIGYTPNYHRVMSVQAGRQKSGISTIRLNRVLPDASCLEGLAC